MTDIKSVSDLSVGERLLGTSCVRARVCACVINVNILRPISCHNSEPISPNTIKVLTITRELTVTKNEKPKKAFIHQNFTLNSDDYAGTYRYR